MLSVLGFLAILAPLVIVHEFGHYIFARIFGVKAEIFSIGFGPTLWRKQLGETELRVSAVPLGGYVKLLGEDREAELSPEDAKRALQKQVPWKRFFIFFGGPLFNFVFAILVFAAILVIGERHYASYANRVVKGSVAEKVGFRSGDKILAVNGKAVQKFDEMMGIVAEHPGKPVTFQVQHPGAAQPVEIQVTPSQESGFSVYGEETSVGDIDGLFPIGRATQVGISDPGSAAAKAGLKTGDQITALNGKPVTSWEELEASIAALPGDSSVDLSIKKSGSGAAEKIVLNKPAAFSDLASTWGLHSSELFVDKVLPDSPAAKAGLKSGDRLIGVGSEEVQSFYNLRTAVQKSGEKTGKVELKWEREGKVISQTVTPTAKSVKDPVLKETTQYTVGVMPLLVGAEPPVVIERTYNPFKLLYRATERMVVVTWRNIVSIGKMIKGDVGISSLGGPIMIGKIAGESIARGLISFLTTMGILSVGLGVLNVLPIPVLDGGHLLLLAIEAVRGKPLTVRQMEVIQQIGLSLILLLMVIVFKNDIQRLSIFE